MLRNSRLYLGCTIHLSRAIGVSKPAGGQPIKLSNRSKTRVLPDLWEILEMFVERTAHLVVYTPTFLHTRGFFCKQLRISKNLNILDLVDRVAKIIE